MAPGGPQSSALPMSHGRPSASLKTPGRSHIQTLTAAREHQSGRQRSASRPRQGALMPTTLPSRPNTAALAQRLSWPDTARLLILLLRLQWLNRQLEGARRRVARQGLDVAGVDLVFIARRWLETHEAVHALLRTPEPPEVAKVRATLRPLDEIRRRAAFAPPPPVRPSRR